METFLTLVDIACGRPIPEADTGRSRRLQLVVFALLASLVFAAAWGVAAGSRSAGLAVANLYKVPMVVLLSCAFAAPAGLLAWRLSGSPVRGSDLALGFAGGMFGGTLVLAVLAPLLALYYHSSAWAGPVLGIGSAGLALLAGTVMFVSGVMRRLEPGTKKRFIFLPVIVTLTMQVLTLLQLASIAAPIFPSGLRSVAESITSRPPQLLRTSETQPHGPDHRSFGCGSDLLRYAPRHPRNGGDGARITRFSEALVDDARVAGALFTPTRVLDGVDWRAGWVLSWETAQDIEQGATRTLRFAVPLPASARIEAAPGMTVLSEQGEVVGVRVDRAALFGRLVSAVVHQQLPRRGNQAPIGAPVAAGSSFQIIDADLGGGTRLEVDTGRLLERRVGYVAPAGVSLAARAEACRLTGYDPHIRGAAIYVRGDDVKAASGLVANLESARSRAYRSAIGIAILFGAILVALFVAVVKLRSAADVERADAILAAELDGLGAGRESRV